MYVIDYYKESKTKSNKRTEILTKSSELFQSKPIELISMKEVSDFLNIERRTLYVYYNNKQDLIVDVLMFILEDIAKKTLNNNSHDFLFNEQLSTREKLHMYFEIFMTKTLPTFKHYYVGLGMDSFFNKMDRTSESFKRYLLFSQHIKNEDKDLQYIIKEGLDNGSIKHTGATEKDIARILEGCIRTYAIKTDLRQDFTDFYQESYVKSLVEILINGLLR